ncbi:hypothetical protein AAL_08287 [Moelleriella libera RCEF 2490]|uniref:CPAF-like PDZ domain-containing protein n=1 Tax=Moelleriella libera RCEF 2490 TaxID=1081109 RepID=A0A167VNH9_9HYPO|nr:hypothetical protein AAL_08287 [Moelleriella libera RCEF 2490]
MKLLALLVVSSLADVVIALPKASSNSSCSANDSSCSNPSSSASSSASSPSNSPSQDSINDACAKISKAVAEAIRTNATSLPPIPAEEGLSCLKSMPFDKSLGGQFLTQLRKYIAFQTTLEPLKNPPSTYVGSPVDVLGGLDKIAAKLGTYTSQFDFDSDIKSLVKTANDGHFSVKLCSTEVYRFSRPVSIVSVSVSKDGLELPELYTGSDAALLGGGGNGKAVSPIVAING